jgi:hypothetical protein
MSTSRLNSGLSSMSYCHLKIISDPWHVAYCLNTEFDFGEFLHHPLEMYMPTILIGSTSRKPVDLNQESMEAL